MTKLIVYFFGVISGSSCSSSALPSNDYRYTSGGKCFHARGVPKIITLLCHRMFLPDGGVTTAQLFGLIQTRLPIIDNSQHLACQGFVEERRVFGF